VTQFTEIDYYISSYPAEGFATVQMKDVNGNVAGVGTVLPTERTRFSFPIPSIFSSLPLTSIRAPFMLDLQLNPGDVLYVDSVILRTDPYFAIFPETCPTQYERAELLSWGGTCVIQEYGSHTIVQRILRVPSGTWGCGLFFLNPTLDLSSFGFLEFYLTSNVEVKIEVESIDSGKNAVYIPSTGGQQRPVKISLLQFGLDLHNTNAPFMITKVGQNPDSEVVVEFVRYTPPPSNSTGNSGLLFNGTTCVKIPHQPQLLLPGDYTVELRIQTNQVSSPFGDADLFEKWNESVPISNAHYPVVVRLLTPSGFVAVAQFNYMIQPIFFDFYTSSPVSVNNGQLHHIVAVRQDRTQYLYIDGALVSSYYSPGSDPAHAANDLPLFLGCRGSSRNETGYINYYAGQMAGVRAWNFAKDALEIAAMAKYALQYNDELPLPEFDPNLVGYWPLSPSTIHGDLVDDLSIYHNEGIAHYYP